MSSIEQKHSFIDLVNYSTNINVYKLDVLLVAFNFWVT